MGGSNELLVGVSFWANLWGLRCRANKLVSLFAPGGSLALLALPPPLVGALLLWLGGPSSHDPSGEPQRAHGLAQQLAGRLHGKPAGPAPWVACQAVGGGCPKLPRACRECSGWGPAVGVEGGMWWGSCPDSWGVHCVPHHACCLHTTTNTQMHVWASVRLNDLLSVQIQRYNAYTLHPLDARVHPLRMHLVADCVWSQLSFCDGLHC